jgi:hypothetical protein
MLAPTPNLDKVDSWLPGLIGTVSTIDTRVALSRRYDKEVLAALRGTGAGEVHPEPRGPRNKRGKVTTIYWWAYVITRPTRRTFECLDDLALDEIKHYQRTDVATDFRFIDDRHATAGLWKLSDALQMKWKFAKQAWYETTLYWECTSGAIGQPARQMVLYPSYRHANTIRLELSFRCSQSVRANGLHKLTPRALMRFNPRELYKKHVAVKTIDEAWLQGVAKRELARATGDWWSPKCFQDVADRYRNVHRHGRVNLPLQALDADPLLSLIPTRLHVPE